MKIIIKRDPVLIYSSTVTGPVDVELQDVFSGVTIPTDQGLFGIAQRDGGLEIMLDGKLVWNSHGNMPSHAGSTGGNISPASSRAGGAGGASPGLSCKPISAIAARIGRAPIELVPGRQYRWKGKVYEFSRIGGTGKAIIHEPGEPDMQSSSAVDPGELEAM